MNTGTEMLRAAGGRGSNGTPPPLAASAEPIRLAESLRAFTFEIGGNPTLVRWARAWWRYDGSRYVEHDDELLERDIQRFLDRVVVEKTDDNGQVRRERVTSRIRTINEVRKALVHVFPVIEGDAPKWIRRHPDDQDADRYVPCGNGLLHLRDRKLVPATPRLFAVNTLGTNWEPDGPEPKGWFAFLHSVWPDDAESTRALQQLLGYLISYDTQLQKLFAIIGPTRSGKGTIARVVKALLGGDAVVSPTLASLERPFGLAPLVGKSAAIIGDARLGGRAEQAQVVERLLSISGEDPLSIDRKNRDPIDVRLRTRVLLVSNELPRLYDTSGALASRFVILQTRRSFLGEEDLGLERRLLAELPGILRWAVEGYHDLLEAGRFVHVAASEVAREHMESISSPIAVFLREICRVEDTAQVEDSVLYEKWVSWCKTNGREATNAQVFGRDLHTSIPGLKIVRPRRPDNTRPSVYEGVGLA